MVVLKAMTMTYVMSILDLIEVCWSTTQEERNQSTNLDVVLAERNKSPTDEV